MPEPLLRDMLGRGRAMPLEEALTVLAAAMADLPLPATEEVSLETALHRYCGRDCVAPEQLPNHPRSVMDGFAVHAADTFGASAQLPAYLLVSGEIRVGEMPTGAPGSGECHRIPTGGLLPEGCDAVVMLEHTIQSGDDMIEVVRPVAPGMNIIGPGDDVQRHEVLLPAGHLLRPCDLGLLAGLGITRLPVYRRPVVGIISSGNEIVPPDQCPPPGKIRDMNMQTISAMVVSQGAEARPCGIVDDDEAAFGNLVQRALDECDMVLFSGGSSVGVGDLGERVLTRLTSPGILVHGVAVKPGKPVIIAMHGQIPVFGLPGHPVSAATAYALFVRPALACLAGDRRPAWKPQSTGRVVLQRNLNSAAGRTDLVPVTLTMAETGDDGLPTARPVLGKSSALSTLVRADGWIMIPPHLQGLTAGSQVDFFHF